MRRDYFTLEVEHLDAGAAEMPAVHIDFEGPGDQLTDRLTDGEGEPLAAEELDVSYRLQTPVDDADAEGVVAVTNRVTGEFVLELNAAAGDVFAFIDAARSGGQAADEANRYRIIVAIDGEEVLDCEKGTFLVYDDEGGLLRGHSLIPSGVEL